MLLAGSDSEGGKGPPMRWADNFTFVRALIRQVWIIATGFTERPLRVLAQC